MTEKTHSALIWQWFEKGELKGLDANGHEIHYYKCKVCLEHLEPFFVIILSARTVPYF